MRPRGGYGFSSSNGYGQGVHEQMRGGPEEMSSEAGLAIHFAYLFPSHTASSSSCPAGCSRLLLAAAADPAAQHPIPRPPAPRLRLQLRDHHPLARCRLPREQRHFVGQGVR
ncbi:unnamed protein product [Urochloa humidicola]